MVQKNCTWGGEKKTKKQLDFDNLTVLGGGSHAAWCCIIQRRETTAQMNKDQLFSAAL